MVAALKGLTIVKSELKAKTKNDQLSIIVL
jgi:hypothetical protein